MHEASARAADLRRRVRTRRIVAVALGMALLGLAALVQSEWQLSPPVRRLAGRAAYRGAKADLAHARARASLRGTIPGPSPVLITEVSAENRDVILDDDLAPSDWIELYNRSDRPVPLAGWRLAEAGRPHRGWVFPAITLPGRSYVVVWLSGKNRVGSAAGRRVNTLVTNEVNLRHEVNDSHLPLPGGNYEIAKANLVEVSLAVPGPGQYQLWMKASVEGLSGKVRVRVPGSPRVIVRVPGGGQPQNVLVGDEDGFPMAGPGPHGIEITAVTGTVHVDHLAFVRPGPLEDRFARQLHASFRLQRGRESVMLLDPWGGLRDQVPLQDLPPTLTLQREPETLTWRAGLATPAGRQMHPGPDLAAYPSLSRSPLLIAPPMPPGVEELHFTRNGSVPTMEAPRLQRPLRLTQPTVVRVRGFADGMPVTPIVTRQFWVGPAPATPTLMLALDSELIADPEIGIETNDRWRRQQDLPDDAALGPFRMTRRRDWARVRRPWIKPANLLALDADGILFDGRARVRRFTTAVGPGFGWHIKTRELLRPTRDIFGRPLTAPGRSILVDEDDLNVPSYDLVRAVGGLSAITKWGSLIVNGSTPSRRVMMEPIDEDFLLSRWGHTDFDVLKGKPFTVKRGTSAEFDALTHLMEGRGWTATDVAPRIDLPHLMALQFAVLYMANGYNSELWQTDFMVDHGRMPPLIHAVGWDLDHGFDDPSQDTLALQRKFVSRDNDRGPAQAMELLLALLDTDPSFRQTYVRYAERMMNHVLTSAWWDARRREAGTGIAPARAEQVARFFRARPALLSESLASGLDLPPPHVARVDVRGNRSLTIDGFPHRGRYEGRYFEGGTLEVVVPPEARAGFQYFTVNGRREAGPLLRLPVTDNLEVVARFSE
jgi:Lamin Tail Domain